MMPTGRVSVTQTMLSIPHMIVVFVIVLVVFGPQKLPELARGLGKLMAEFRKASTDFKSAFENEMRDLERQAAEVERKKRELLAAAATQLQPATFATPSGAETQPAPAALAPPEADQGPTEGIVVTPVVESVPRSFDNSDAGQGMHATETSQATASTEPAPDVPASGTESGPSTISNEETPGGSQLQDPERRDLLDTTHDYKQPA
jgi:sec-independent protein translocase protein TatB